MAIPAREPAARKEIAHVGVDKRAREALERGRDRPVMIVIAGEKAFLERAVARDDVARGGTERDEIIGAIEAIDEVTESRGVARGIEVAYEAPRRADAREDQIQLRAEEIDPAVGKTRGEERDDLAIARIGIAQRETDRVALDARGVIEVSIEPLERLTQDGIAFAHGSSGLSDMSPRSDNATLDEVAGAGAAPRRRLTRRAARGYGLPVRRDAKRVGVIGLGAIGRRVCEALDEGITGLSLAGATARDRGKAERFLAALGSKPPFLTLDQLIDACDLLVEASTQAHLDEIAPKALGRGRDLIVLSCGGLLGRDDWVKLAEANGCRILVPSGAIAGLDGVKGARVGAVRSVTMETRKPPRGLAGAPWIVERGIDLDAIHEDTIVFEGPATEACRAFPANVNVLAALSLAGIGPERTRIRIHAVPGLTRNQHSIRIEGEFGALTIEVENVPSENPRTGKLSYLSTIALLRDLGATLVVGT
jgi:aspartate dehydrogenase